MMCAVTLIVRRTEAQSCPAGNPCAGDPCCGVVGCTPSELACLAAGWIWNGACSQPAGNAAACDEVGMFWNFTSNVCQTDPPTVLTCQNYGAYWNHTIGSCGSSPAIGMCGGGADWANYFTTGCWTGLGLFGGAGPFAIVVLALRISAFSSMAITISNIACAPAVVGAVVHQFSSMSSADSR